MTLPMLQQLELFLHQNISASEIALMQLRPKVSVFSGSTDEQMEYA